MKRASFSRWLGGIAMILAMSPSWANAVEINLFLTNASFETGLTGWTGSGSVNAYAPGTSQYTPGADGLSGTPRSAPDGTMVASIPSFPNTTGSGTLLQSTSFTWQPNTDYTFTFYLGIPKGDIAPQGALAVFFLENGVQDGLPRFDLTGTQVPTAGNWVLDTLSFHTASSGAAYLGQPIGVEFFASTTNNGQEANFDIAAVPGPVVGAGVPGLVAACAGLLGLARRRRRQIV
jgi:hypothetical protein